MKTIPTKNIISIIALGLIIILNISACRLIQPGENLQNEVITSNYPSAIKTEAPTAYSLPTPDLRSEIFKQVNLFLNSEEPYRKDEDLYWKIFWPYHTQNIQKLGVMGIYFEQGSVSFQGVFLGWIETADGIVLFVGEQDDKENRFVTPLKLYDQKYEIFKDVGGGFTFLIRDKYHENTLGDPIEYNSKKDVEAFLTTKIGGVLGFQLSLLPSPPLTEEDKNDMLSIGWIDPDLAIKQMNDLFANYLELNKQLTNSLWIPSPNDLNIQFEGLTIRQAIEKMGGTSNSALKITSIEDIDHVVQTQWLPSPDFLEGIH